MNGRPRVAHELAEHSERKHKILKEYVRRYLLERCKSPLSGV